MAEVQLARLRGAMGFEKLVVVKLVHEHLASQKSFVEMLMQEARLAALVKHPNVVDIYDLGESEGRYFVAMEYLAGEPMLALLRAGRDGKRLDPLSTARLIAEVAEGLSAAHTLRSMAGEAMPLVHHDVSLGNIMVLYTGQAKLVDFGVAKAGDKAHEADKDRIKGKFGYMAPEKLRGEGGDARSDLFSLGVVLWEALTLRRLFRANSDLEAIQQILEDEILPPSEVNGEVPKAFDRICLKALERDVRKRYQTAAELARDIEGVLREASYSGKYEAIAAYMQETFAEHICARSQLIKEAATAPGPSPQLDELVSVAFSPADRGSSSPGIFVEPPELPERAIASAAAEAVRGRLGKGKAAAAADEETMQSPVIDAEAEAAAARRAEEEKAAEVKRRAEEQAAEVKRVAEAKAAEVRKAAEAKAAEVRKAAEAKKLALAAAAESTATEVVADIAGKAAAAAAEARKAEAKKAAEKPEKSDAKADEKLEKSDAKPEKSDAAKADAPVESRTKTPSQSARLVATTDGASSAKAATGGKLDAELEAKMNAAVAAAAPPSLLSSLAATAGTTEAYFEPSQKPIADEPKVALPGQKHPTATEVSVPAAPVIPGAASSVRTAMMWADQEPSVTELSPQWTNDAITEVSPNGTARSLIPHIPKIAPARGEHPLSEEGESTEVSASPIDPQRAFPPASAVMNEAGRPGRAPEPTPHLGELLAGVSPGARATPPSGNHLGPAAGVIQAPEPRPGSTTGTHPTRAMGTRSGTDSGGRDVLGGWGWTTGATGAIAADEITATRLAERRRNRWLLGGGVGVLALIVIVAVAAGGEDGTGPGGTALSAARAASGEEAPEESDTFAGAQRPDQIALAPELVPAGGEPAVAHARGDGDADKRPAGKPPRDPGAKSAAAGAAGSAEPATPAEPVDPDSSAAPASADAKSTDASPAEAVRKPNGGGKSSGERDRQREDERDEKKKPELDVEATFKAGQSEFLRGDAKAALATFRKLLAASPSYAPAWRGSGLAHERLGQKAAAAKALRRYLKLAPSASDAAQIKARLERLE